MCLYCFKNIKICTAQEDIVVYKALLEKKVLGIFKTYHAPYHLGFKYRKGKIVKSGLRIDNDGNCKYVEIGLHSLTSLEDACMYSSYRFIRPVFAKLIIPKGAKYVTGYTCDFKCYASNQLKLIEILHN